jgi:hypothetical protein
MPTRKFHLIFSSTNDDLHSDDFKQIQSHSQVIIVWDIAHLEKDFKFDGKGIMLATCEIQKIGIKFNQLPAYS